ncbi:MAG: hypothetical protein HZY76_04155 [Anaerolineae bacterium]|nr:MAG: hypothetical protein HZY76_04155 [Anaerolineae bacterium]
MIIGLLATTLAPVAAAAVPTAVVISSFTAAYVGGNAINIQWTTESEVDLALFILYRGQAPLSPSQPGNQVYQAAPQGGGGVGGFTYNFSDTGNLVQGASYYYMLKVLETTGGEQFFYANGSQAVVFGITPHRPPPVRAPRRHQPSRQPRYRGHGDTYAAPTATAIPGATVTPTPPFTSTPTPFATTFVTNTPVPLPATNTPPPGATATPPFFTLTPMPSGTFEASTGTPPFDSGTITAMPATAAPVTSETVTPGAIEASPTAPPPPPTETPTRMPSRTQTQATATPEATGAARTTAATGLLLCLGGGAIFGAGLLVVVGFVLWRRQPNAGGHSDDQR